MKVYSKLVIVLTSTLCLTACPQAKKATHNDGVTLQGGPQAGKATGVAGPTPAPQATQTPAPVAEDKGLPRETHGTNDADTETQPQGSTPRATPKPAERPPVLTRNQMREKERNTPANHSEKCHELGQIEKRLLSEPGLREAEKTKIVNTILVSLGAANCPEIVSDLKNAYKDDPVADLIRLRTQQLTKPTARNITNLVYEMFNADIPMQLNAKAVWEQAEDIHIRSNNVAEGTLKYEDRTVRVLSQLPQDAKLPENPKKDDVAKLIDPQQTLNYFGLEGNVIVVKDADRTETVDKAAKALQAVDEKVKKQKEDASKPATTEAPGKKLTFDRDDLSLLAECDNTAECRNNKAQCEGLTIGTLSGARKIQQGSTLKVNLSLDPQLDPELIPVELVGKSQEEIAVLAMVPVEQTIADQAFWHFAKRTETALEFKHETRMDEQSPKIYTTLKAYNYHKKLWDKKTDPAIHYVVADDIRTSSDVTPAKEYHFTFNPMAAYWLKKRVESIASCMEKSPIGAPGASRDSVLDYILYKVFESHIKSLTNAMP